MSSEFQVVFHYFFTTEVLLKYIWNVYRVDPERFFSIPLVILSSNMIFFSFLLNFLAWSLQTLFDENSLRSILVKVEVLSFKGEMEKFFLIFVLIKNSSITSFLSIEFSFSKSSQLTSSILWNFCNFENRLNIEIGRESLFYGLLSLLFEVYTANKRQLIFDQSLWSKLNR